MEIDHDPNEFHRPRLKIGSMDKEPFWGRNWYILLVLAAIVIVGTWLKPERSRTVNLGGGVTIRKISDERSDKMIIRQMSPD